MEQTQRKNVFSLQLNMHFTQTCNRWFHEAVVDVQYKNHAINKASFDNSLMSFDVES